MVARSPIAGIRYRNSSSDSPGIGPATTDMVEDLDLTTVAHFTTTGARDAAYATAIAGTGPYSANGDGTGAAVPRVGMVCTVGTSVVVAYMWNGASWVPDLARRVAYDASKTFSGLAPGLDHSLSFDSGGTPAGVFVTHASGITIVEPGVYVATLNIFLSPGSAGRTYVAINAAAAQSELQLSTAPSTQRGSVSMNGVIMGANSQMAFLFGHNNAGTASVQGRLMIAKISS